MRLRGVPGELRCTVAAPSSVVLPTPLLSEVPFLAHHSFTQGAPGAPVVAHWVPDHLRALTDPPLPPPQLNAL